MNPRTRRYYVSETTYPAISNKRFLALDLAIEVVGNVHELVNKAPPSASALVDQARRSSVSIPLNLSEGAGRSGRDRLQHWRIAHASSKETTTAIQLLHAMGILNPQLAAHTLAQLDRVNALTYRLAHPRT